MSELASLTRSTTRAILAAHSEIYKIVCAGWKLYPKLPPFDVLGPRAMSTGGIGEINAACGKIAVLEATVEQLYGERDRLRYFVENWPQSC